MRTTLQKQKYSDVEIVADNQLSINIKNKYEKAQPGDAVIYHRGFLAKDRKPENPAIPVKVMIADNVSRLADFFFNEYSNDNCTLIQERICDQCFEYIAIKR